MYHAEDLKFFLSRTVHLHHSQIPAEEIGSSSTYYIDTSTLGLDKDFEFHMFLRACQSNYTVSETRHQHHQRRKHRRHRR